LTKDFYLLTLLKTVAMKRITLFAFIVISVAGLLHGQNIDNCHVLPATPTVQDYIYIVYDAHFPSSSCALNEWDLTGNGYILNLSTLHEQGMLSVICYSSETIPVGNLAAGNYTLNLTVSIPGSSASTVINFTVSGIVPVEETEQSTQVFYAFPNPVYDILTFETDVHCGVISIFNSAGVAVMIVPFSRSIDVSHLPDGFYTLMITTEKGNLPSKFLKFP